MGLGKCKYFVQEVIWEVIMHLLRCREDTIKERTEGMTGEINSSHQGCPGQGRVHCS